MVTDAPASLTSAEKSVVRAERGAKQVDRPAKLSCAISARFEPAIVLAIIFYFGWLLLWLEFAVLVLGIPNVFSVKPLLFTYLLVFCPELIAGDFVVYIFANVGDGCMC